MAVFETPEKMAEMTKQKNFQEIAERPPRSTEECLPPATARAGEPTTNSRLTESEARFRDLLDNANDLIQSITPDGSFLYVNRAWMEALEYNIEEVTLLNVFDVIHPDCHQHCTETFQRLFGGEEIGKAELDFVSKSGNKISVEGSVNCKFKNGKPVLTRGFFRDITDRREAEENLRRSETNYRTLIEQASDGIFITDKEGNFAEINSQGCEMLGYDCDDLIQLNLKDIITVEDLAQNPFQFEELRRGKIVRAERVMRCKNGDYLPVEISKRIIADEHLQIIVRDISDRRRAEQELSRSEKRYRSIVKEHPAGMIGDFVLLSVSDNGCGMDEKTLAHIFEPFFTTKEIGKGTGLGLSTVYGIVKQSGGYVWVYSEPNMGTTFKVYLPRVEMDETKTDEESHTESRGGSETILLVEDEELLRPLVREILEAQGYKVLVASHSAEAIAQSEQYEGEIDLLLTDVVLPQQSGRELAEWMLKARPGIEVLYMSGYTDDAIVHHGILDAGTNFIQKPFSLDALAVKIRELLEEKSEQGFKAV